MFLFGDVEVLYFRAERDICLVDLLGKNHCLVIQNLIEVRTQTNNGGRRGKLYITGRLVWCVGRHLESQLLGGCGRKAITCRRSAWVGLHLKTNKQEKGKKI